MADDPYPKLAGLLGLPWPPKPPTGEAPYTPLHMQGLMSGFHALSPAEKAWRCAEDAARFFREAGDDPAAVRVLEAARPRKSAGRKKSQWTDREEEEALVELMKATAQWPAPIGWSGWNVRA